jgi:hypothetical protein
MSSPAAIGRHGRGALRVAAGRLLIGLAGLAVMMPSAPAHAAPAAPATPPTVLHVTTERLTDIVFGYRYQPTLSNVGFGSAAQPWHTWYSGAEVRPLLHLPGGPASLTPGVPLRPKPEQLIGNRFRGQAWPSGFSALASFDADGNGIVEGRELRELYIWIDIDGSGTISTRDDALRPASFYYQGFDLRQAPVLRRGAARDGHLLRFSVLVPYTSRINLLELPITERYATPLDGLLASFSLQPPGTAPDAFTPETGHPLAGRWRWTITNTAQWTDASRPWGPEAGGELFLAVSQGRVRGLVRTVSGQHDRVNLPLQGQVREGRAQWTSVSPLGLTRSEVRLETLNGHPILRGRAFSTRNGRVSEWTWEARREPSSDN